MRTGEEVDDLLAELDRTDRTDREAMLELRAKMAALRERITGEAK
jgi:hypothetical protein